MQRVCIRVCLAQLLIFVGFQVEAAQRLLVNSPKTYQSAMKKAAPGDTIVLANGEWRNFEMVLQGKGKPGRLITVEAQTPGMVILKGRSNLRLAGEYLHVRGLVFRDGYSPSGEVITFRKDDEQLANHSRVSEMVIDGFSHPERHESDHWIVLFGKNNRVDHNHFVGKTNAGVTFAVRLDDNNSRNSHHQVDHNYFGPRPVLGSNGGETLRIGTSDVSMFDSKTTVESNYFEKCNGEVEIISNKSGGNVFRGNVFDASEGTLTLRHGDGNLVENNVFLGRGVANTGGIRVINRNQHVRNNYMEGLRGTGFAGALTIMNGVPNSPVNRYVQVSNAVVESNTIVDSHRLVLAAGADTERSAPPIGSKFSNNLMLGIAGKKLIAVEDDISGIAFSGNLMDLKTRPFEQAGVARQEIKMQRASNGLLYPTDASIEAGVAKDLVPIEREQTGVAWYPKPRTDNAAASAPVTTVAPGSDTLSAAMAAADDGATLQLSAGFYDVSRVLKMNRTIAIVGPRFAEIDESAAATIRFSRTALFELHSGAKLNLSDLIINGDKSPDVVGNSVIRTASFPGAAGVELKIARSRFTNLDVNAAFNVISLGKNSLVEKLSISDSAFLNISGSVLEAIAETDDYGRYNADLVTVTGSQFSNIEGAAFALYRGGTDESTFGPRFYLSSSTFNAVGLGKRNRSKACVLLHGVQFANVRKNTFEGSAPIRVRHTVGEPRTSISNNQFSATPLPQAEELNFSGASRVSLKSNRVEIAK